MKVETDREVDRCLAEQAVASGDLIGSDRARTLLLLADCNIREQRYDEALTALQELTRVRRNSEDWRLIAVCYLKQGQPRQALDRALGDEGGIG